MGSRFVGSSFTSLFELDGSIINSRILILLTLAVVGCQQVTPKITSTMLSDAESSASIVETEEDHHVFAESEPEASQPQPRNVPQWDFETLVKVGKNNRKEIQVDGFSSVSTSAPLTIQARLESLFCYSGESRTARILTLEGLRPGSAIVTAKRLDGTKVCKVVVLSPSVFDALQEPITLTGNLPVRFSTVLDQIHAASGVAFRSTTDIRKRLFVVESSKSRPGMDVLQDACEQLRLTLNPKSDGTIEIASRY